MDSLEDDETIPVWAWFLNIDTDKVERELQKVTGYTTETIRQMNTPQYFTQHSSENCRRIIDEFFQKRIQIIKDMYDENIVSLYGISTKDLELDKEYNIKEIGKKAGHIVLYIEDNTITSKRASEILINIKDILDKENINFYAIDFILEKPRKEDGTPNEDNSSIRVEHFLYKDIYEENLDKRIENSYKNLMKYYNEQDLKKEEMDL